MKVEQNDLLLAVAKLIRKYEISIGEFYEHLGVDLESYRAEPGHKISQLAGILTGWDTDPDDS